VAIFWILCLTSALISWIIFREILYTRLRKTLKTLQEEGASVTSELEFCRRENHFLKETQSHTQSLLRETSSQLSGTQLDQRIQGACSQAFLATQKSFTSLLEPLLAQFHQNSQGQLKEHSSFLTHLVHPLQQRLQDLSQHVQYLEQNRIGAYEGLKEQISHLSQGQKVLHTETNALITALRTPHIRGCWGEMQLRRVVELAGMSSYCDFQDQPSLQKSDSRLRPDMIITLPGDKQILVDAKAPLLHYLESTSAKTSEEYHVKLKEHARTLASHIKALSDKKYWAHHGKTVEFVLLFLPGEAFLSTALESDPSLIEYATERHIILATPITLIALLKTIAHGWRQEKISQHTHFIISLSKDLLSKLASLQNHMDHMGKSLRKTLSLYQEASFSLETHILPSAHQLSVLPSQEEAPPVANTPQESPPHINPQSLSL
jgi:DNA recombination protein RmuC